MTGYSAEIIMQNIIISHLTFMVMCPMWAQGNPPLSRHFPTSPSFSIFSFFPFLIHASSIFLLFIPSHSTRIVPLCFHARMSWEATKHEFSFICVDFVFNSIFS